MKTMSFELDTDLCNMIQQRQYELEGLKHLIGFALSTTEYNIPVEKIDELKNEFAKVNQEYEFLKQTVTDLIPSDYDRNLTSWNLDFNSRVVNVVEK